MTQLGKLFRDTFYILLTLPFRLFRFWGNTEWFHLIRGVLEQLAKLLKVFILFSVYLTLSEIFRVLWRPFNNFGDLFTRYLNFYLTHVSAKCLLKDDLNHSTYMLMDIVRIIIILGSLLWKLGTYHFLGVFPIVHKRLQIDICKLSGRLGYIFYILSGLPCLRQVPVSRNTITWHTWFGNQGFPLILRVTFRLFIRNRFLRNDLLSFVWFRSLDLPWIWWDYIYDYSINEAFVAVHPSICSF